jgi:hypothetical protein
MASAAKDPRQEVVDLVDSLYRDYQRGSLKLHRASLAQDVVLLGAGDPRVLKGKESYLSYLRTASKKSRLHNLRTRVEDLKFLNDLAILVQSYTSQLEIEGRPYQEVGRVTTVLIARGGHWYLTHVHMESLARNPIVA